MLQAYVPLRPRAPATSPIRPRHGAREALFPRNLNAPHPRQAMCTQVTLHGYVRLHAIHTDNHFEGTVLGSPAGCYLLASPSYVVLCVVLYLFLFETWGAKPRCLSPDPPCRAFRGHASPSLPRPLLPGGCQAWKITLPDNKDLLPFGRTEDVS